MAIPMPSSWLSIVATRAGMAGTHVLMKDIHVLYMCRQVAQRFSTISFHAWFIWFQVMLSWSTQFKQHLVRGPNNPLSNFHPAQLQSDGQNFTCLEQAYHWLKLQHHNVDPANLLTRTGLKLPFIIHTLSNRKNEDQASTKREAIMADTHQDGKTCASRCVQNARHPITSAEMDSDVNRPRESPSGPTRKRGSHDVTGIPQHRPKQ